MVKKLTILQTQLEIPLQKIKSFYKEAKGLWQVQYWVFSKYDMSSYQNWSRYFPLIVIMMTIKIMINMMIQTFMKWNNHFREKLDFRS